jgi:hypothetical protein
MSDAFTAEVEQQLQTKVKEAVARAAKETQEKLAEQLKELQESLQEKEADIKTFRTNELDLRKQKQTLEKAKEDFDLKLQRQLDQERASIRTEAESRMLEQHRLKDLEKEKLVNDLKSALEDMKRKADQGSMQTQGRCLSRPSRNN